MNNQKILIKKIVKVVPIKEIADLCLLKFLDGKEAVGIYEHFRKNDYGVVIPSSFVFKSWFFNIFEKYLKYDYFCLPIRMFDKLKPTHNGTGKIDHYEKDGLDVTNLLIDDLIKENE